MNTTLLPSPLHRGILVSIEGIDGSGKTTLARILRDRFFSIGFKTFLTKEPGGTPLGVIFREFLQYRTSPIDSKVDYLIFAADRAQHISEIIKPKLQEKYLIISDRFADSSLAYQGYGKGLDLGIIKQINEWVMQGVEQNITIYLKTDPLTAFERIKHRGTIPTTYEQEGSSFMERVSHGFDTIFALRNNVITIDGSQNQNKVTEHTFNELYSWLETHSLFS